MKVLLLSEVFPPQNGGSGRWFWEMYSRMKPSEVVFAVGQHPEQKGFDQDKPFKIERIKLSSRCWGLLSKIGSSFYLKKCLKIIALVRSQKITEIHCGRCLPEGVMAWFINKLLGIPYICYIHGEDVEAAAMSRELTWMVKRVLASSKKLIANSHNTQRILSQKWGVQADKISVLHPGVDVQRFSPAPAINTWRERNGWQNKQIILTVGRLQKRKGHDMLLRALPQLKQNFPDLLYLIVGDGDQKQNLQALTQDLKLEANVKFLDEISDAEMIQCYQQSDVFILPNRQVDNDIEGFGMVLVEAQACGIPVVAGNSGGTAETMVVGETGLVVDCTSAQPIVNALSQLLSDVELRKQMGKKGRHHALKSYGWDAILLNAREIFGQKLAA